MLAMGLSNLIVVSITSAIALALDVIEHHPRKLERPMASMIHTITIEKQELKECSSSTSNPKEATRCSL
jgi:hypothetical protein